MGGGAIGGLPATIAAVATLGTVVVASAGAAPSVAA